jgi:hypothetical protein
MTSKPRTRHCSRPSRPDARCFRRRGQVGAGGLRYSSRTDAHGHERR